MDNTQYFYRTVIFTRHGDQIALANIDNPQQTTPLEEWLGLVISLADGQHSIQQLIDFLAAQYSQVPDKLEDTVHSVIERLTESQMLQLSDHAIDLPYYLASPIEELDLEKARALIKEHQQSVH